MVVQHLAYLYRSYLNVIMHPCLFRYVKIRNDMQLRDPKKANDTSNCDPESNNGGSIVPCGLIAWSLFNDTYTLTVNNRNLTINKKGISWKSDRDLVARALDRLGWQKVFRHIKISPGKGVGFGLVEEKPIFILPGGPPANFVAFLEIALPGLLRLAGWKEPGLPEKTVTLARSVTGRKDWTQFVFGRLIPAGNPRYIHPLRLSSRLRSMAHADGIIAIPKGLSSLEEGASVLVQVLR